MYFILFYFSLVFFFYIILGYIIQYNRIQESVIVLGFKNTLHITFLLLYL